MTQLPKNISWTKWTMRNSRYLILSNSIKFENYCGGKSNIRSIPAMWSNYSALSAIFLDTTFPCSLHVFSCVLFYKKRLKYKFCWNVHFPPQTDLAGAHAGAKESYDVTAIWLLIRLLRVRIFTTTHVLSERLLPYWRFLLHSFPKS